MTEQGVMPDTARSGGSANDQKSLLNHTAGAEREGACEKLPCSIL